MSRQFKSRAFSLNPRFNYLTDKDRHLLSLEAPKYKFNIIGTGINGQEHIEVSYLEGRAGIHGVYDPHPASIAAAQQLMKQWAPGQELVVYDSLEAACLDPEIDGIIICTPNYTHLDIVKVAIQSGKPLLVEKPIATTIEDAFTISEIADDYPNVFQIGLQYRYKPTCSEAIYEVLTRRTIGEVKTISILEHRIPFLDKVNQWNKFAKFSGDTLVEKCCHYFDLLNLFAQARPLNVYASGSMAVNFTDFEYEGEKSDILDNALVIVNYENGVRASFNLCMFAPLFYEELIVCGDDGRLKTSELIDFLPQSSSKTSLEILCGDHKPSRRSTPNYPAHIEQSGHHGATYFEHVNFINNIEGQETQTATAKEGFWSIAVAAAAQESIYTGQVISINDYLARHDIPI